MYGSLRVFCRQSQQVQVTPWVSVHACTPYGVEAVSEGMKHHTMLLGGRQLLTWGAFDANNVASLLALHKTLASTKSRTNKIWCKRSLFIVSDFGQSLLPFAVWTVILLYGEVLRVSFSPMLTFCQPPVTYSLQFFL
jgi:hypothetical protein